MSGGPTPSGPRSPWRGKLVFGLIGGFAATVLAIGLAGEFGKRQASSAAAPPEQPVQQAAAAPPRAAPPAKADAGEIPAPVRTVQRETPPSVQREATPRPSGARPLAIGGPPNPDQFKSVEASLGQASTGQASPARGDAAAGRKVRVIDIPRPPEEAKSEPLGTPDPTSEGSGVAEAAPAGSSDTHQAEASAEPKSEEAGRRLAALPNTPAISGAQPDQPGVEIPLPPTRPAAEPIRNADNDEGETSWRSPHPAGIAPPAPEIAASQAGAQPRPPFKPEPTGTPQSTRQAALPAPPAARPVVVASPARPVRTEPIPNLDRAYRQIQAERQAALRQPTARRPVPNPDRGARQIQAEREPAIREQVPRRARVALGQERRQAAPRQAERASPGQRLVAMHLRTYQGPDGETFDVLYRRRPADPPRSYAGGSGSSRDGVIDWLNR